MKYAIGLLAVVAMLCGCGGGSGKEKEKPAAITVHRTEKREAATVVDVIGNIDTQNRVAIYPRVSGQVTSVLVEVGDVVSRDQLMAEVKQDVPGSEYLPSSVKSTISGTVLKKLVEIGSAVNIQTPMFEVGNTKCLIFSGQIYGEERSQVKVGQTMILIGDRGDTLMGLRVNKLAPQLDPLTGGLAIEAGLCLVKKKLIPGQQVEGQIRIGSVLGIVIPRISLVKDGQGHEGVFVVRNNQAFFHPVRVLSRSEDSFIIDGLEEGLEIVAEGSSGLVQGQKVRIQDKY